MKTLIAIPCMDQVPSAFCQSISTLNRVDECMIAFQVGSLVYESRNKLAQKAIEADADWVLWLDSDMVFNGDLLRRMLGTATKEKTDFVTGVYYRRVEPYTPTLFKTLDFDGGICTWSDVDEIPDKPFEVAGCGFGAVLLHTQVLYDVVAKFDGRMFHPLDGVGEDLSFCWRARQCDYKIIADPTLPLGHMGHMMITKAHCDAYRKLKETKGAGNTAPV